MLPPTALPSKGGSAAAGPNSMPTTPAGPLQPLQIRQLPATAAEMSPVSASIAAFPLGPPQLAAQPVGTAGPGPAATGAGVGATLAAPSTGTRSAEVPLMLS